MQFEFERIIATIELIKLYLKSEAIETKKAVNNGVVSLRQLNPSDRPPIISLHFNKICFGNIFIFGILARSYEKDRFDIYFTNWCLDTD